MGQVFSHASKNEYNGDWESSFTNYFKKIKIESKIISQERISLIEFQLERGNIPGAISAINDELKNINNTPINIAVIGESGAGKSSFINALRGVGPEDEGAAEVGVVPTTMVRMPYKHPKNKMLILWDLPGIGTMKFPTEDYLVEMKFQEYDFFIIVSATCFTKLYLDLTERIRIMKKNYYFVRTKVDIDLENEKKCKPRTFNREKTLQQIRSMYVNAFSQNNMESQIFLISNKLASDYDFPVLMDTLIEELLAQKHHSFSVSLHNIAEALIDRKCKSMQQIILLEAWKDGFLITVPVVGILRDDVEKLKVKLNNYRVLFGVDDSSLEVMARDSQVPAEQLKKLIKSPYLLETEKEILGKMSLKYLEKLSSANGGFLPTGIYLKKTFYLQFLFLETVAEDAKVLLRETYPKISSNSAHPQQLTMDKCYSFLISLTAFVVVFSVLFYLRLWAWNDV